MRKSLIALTFFLLAGCVTSTERLSQISLGMTKPEAAQTLANPYVVRGAIRNRHGQMVEVWETTLAQPKTNNQAVREVGFTVATLGLGAPVLLSSGKEVRYWLYFVDGRLERWGEAGDWGREADRIYEVRFGTASNLSR